MKIILWIVGIAIVLVGAFFVFNTYIYHEKQAPEPVVKEPQINQQDARQYSVSQQKTLPTTADLKATIDSRVGISPLPVLSGTVTSGTMISSGLLGMNLYQKEPQFHGYYSGNVSVSGNQWSAALGSELDPGTYVVDMYILDGHSDFGSNNVITTATLTVK